jgi:predicted kinase
VPTKIRDRVPTLHVYVGLPASGKSTDARLRVLSAPAGQAVRVNNDDARAMLHADRVEGTVTESQIAHARNLLVTAFLTDGVDVYVDDTNHDRAQLDIFVHLTLETGAHFQLLDFTGVAAEECIRRDAVRDRSVGPEAIRAMARKLRRLKFPPAVAPLVAAPPYDPKLEDVVLCDIDGTLAEMGDRSPYEWSRVGEDRPRKAVVSLVRALVSSGKRVIAFSGRDAICRNETQQWLDEHVVPGLDLYMRTTGDNRRDSVVKHEMFHEHIAGHFNVEFVIDDRDQVTRTWRTLGLDCFQVQPGPF